jgi:antitoxin Phd
MTVYTFTEARQKFATLLSKAGKEGKVLIRRKDGALFSLTPEKEIDSPLNVKGIKTKASTTDILAAVRKSRKRE